MATWLRGKHIVFIGSSVARYQYLNLAYHLLHGAAPPFDLTDCSEELLRSVNMSLPDKKGDYEGYWAGYYEASVRLLNANAASDTFELCDCYRGWGHRKHRDDDRWKKLPGEDRLHNVDMRYVRTGEEHGFAALSYAQWFMDEIPFRGHWIPRIHAGRASSIAHKRKEQRGLHACAAGSCGPPYDFEFGGASGESLDPQLEHGANHTEPLLALLRDVILRLDPKPTHIVLGSPWPGGVNGAQWMSTRRAEHILSAGDELTCAACRANGHATLRFVWKADTQTAPCLGGKAESGTHARESIAQGQYLVELARKHTPWVVYDLWSATAGFGDECYNDWFHFNELARTHFNELLLRTLMANSDAGTSSSRALCEAACAAAQQSG